MLINLASYFLEPHNYNHFAALFFIKRFLQCNRTLTQLFQSRSLFFNVNYLNKIKAIFLETWCVEVEMWKPCVKSILNLRRFQCKKYAYLPTITIGLIKSCMSSKIACNAHAILRLENRTSWKRCCTLLIRYKLFSIFILHNQERWTRRYSLCTDLVWR